MTNRNPIPRQPPDAGDPRPPAPGISPPAVEPGWPALPDDLCVVAEALAARGAPSAPPRAAFVDALRERFEDAADHTAAHPTTDLRPATPPPAALPEAGAAPSSAEAGVTQPGRSRPGRSRPSRSGPERSPAGRRVRWTLATVLTVAATVVAVLGAPRLGGVTAPPPVDRATLVARNTQAWADLASLTGAFETGDGWYYEEWISRAPDGGLRFKRYIRPPARTPNRPQWNISDGTTEWVVDAATRRVRVTRAAVPGDFTAVAPNDAMQCTSLALPAGLADGPPPVPVLLDGHPTYRLTGRLADGADAIFWVDAADALVRRIDRPGLGTVWRRQRLAVDPPLATDVFHPQSLVNL